MVVQYENGKIYKLSGIDDNGNELIYIGSTTRKLCQRLSGHIEDFKRNKKISSGQIIALGNYQITLLELFPCKCKDELTSRERYYYDFYHCVNKLRPIRLKGEIEEQKKMYRLENADKIKQYRLENTEKMKYYKLINADRIKEQMKQYHLKNIEKIKQYRLDNADKIKQQIKQYRLDNAEKIKEQKKQYRKNKKSKTNI